MFRGDEEDLIYVLVELLDVDVLELRSKWIMWVKVICKVELFCNDVEEFFG